MSDATQPSPEFAALINAPANTVSPQLEASIVTTEEAKPERPLSSLSADELKAMCAALNAEIIALHEEGKNEEGDALRSKHLKALAELKRTLNPKAYA